MNVLQKTGRKQEALPFRVNERNGDFSTIALAVRVEMPYWRCPIDGRSTDGCADASLRFHLIPKSGS
jgi:hypothetical protein